MNFSAMVEAYSNKSWWANWLVQSQKGNTTPMAEGRYIDPVGRVLLLYDRAAAKDISRWQSFQPLIMTNLPTAEPMGGIILFHWSYNFFGRFQASLFIFNI